LPSDEACAFERYHHLVNGRRGDLKILLHVGFGWRPAMQAHVQVDVRQILTLFGREGFCGGTHAGHPIQLFVRASSEQEARMNVRYGSNSAKPSAANSRRFLAAASARCASSSERRFCWLPTPAPRTRRSRGVSGRIDRPSNQAPLRARQPGGGGAAPRGGPGAFRQGAGPAGGDGSPGRQARWADCCGPQSRKIREPPQQPTPSTTSRPTNPAVRQHRRESSSWPHLIQQNHLLG
jgi:hypothetical protein